MGRCGKSTAKKRRILRMSQKDAAENAEREAMMGTRKGRKMAMMMTSILSLLQLAHLDAQLLLERRALLRLQ